MRSPRHRSTQVRVSRSYADTSTSVSGWAGSSEGACTRDHRATKARRHDEMLARSCEGNKECGTGSPQLAETRNCADTKALKPKNPKLPVHAVTRSSSYPPTGNSTYATTNTRTPDITQHRTHVTTETRMHLGAQHRTYTLPQDANI
jgi:hypothetical protein